MTGAPHTTRHPRGCCLHPATHYRPGQTVACCACGLVDPTGRVVARGFDPTREGPDADEVIDTWAESYLPPDARTMP